MKKPEFVFVPLGYTSKTKIIDSDFEMISKPDLITWLKQNQQQNKNRTKIASHHKIIINDEYKKLLEDLEK